MSTSKTKETKFQPLSKKILLKRGYCCGMKCQNCPYYPKHKAGSTKLKPT